MFHWLRSASWPSLSGVGKKPPMGVREQHLGGTGFAVKGAEKQSRTWRGIGPGEGFFVFLRWKLVCLLLSVIQEERGKEEK